jgi:hypothetical protein
MHVPEVEFALNAINPLSIGMKPVKAQFILHPKPYHQTRCQPDSQAGQVNQGVQLVAKYVSQSYFDVILQHIILQESS